LIGEGGEEEHIEVAEVRSPSDVRDVRVDVLENREVSFKGSSLRRSGGKLADVEAEVDADVDAEVAVELTRRDRVLETLESFSTDETGVSAGGSADCITGEGANDACCVSLGEPVGVEPIGAFAGGITGEILSRRSSVNLWGSLWTRKRWLGS
jgi:hypothetical protein